MLPPRMHQGCLQAFVCYVQVETAPLGLVTEQTLHQSV